MYQDDWLYQKFLPSLYNNFLREKAEQKTIHFVSEKQFAIIVKNFSKEPDNEVYFYRFNDMKVTCEKHYSKRTGKHYFTIDFVDEFLDALKKESEEILSRLIFVREFSPNYIKEFAQLHYDYYMSKLTMYESYVDIFDAGAIEIERAKEATEFMPSILLAIGKFIE